MIKHLLKLPLLPVSWIYGAVVSTRNKLFDIGILKSTDFEVPTICIGNITTGGTGKTPLTEFTIEQISKHFSTACLSRGYKRKTEGFVLATKYSSTKEIGDEPKQIKNKFPNIMVAVDEDRVHGINKLLELENKPQVIVLDDAFQHRYVNSGKKIVLIDYNRPVYKDNLLPYGRLREKMSALRRADIIIITKCPRDLKPIDQNILTKEFNLKAFQKIYFTYVDYDIIHDINGYKIDSEITRNSNILCVTGIANAQSYINELKELGANVTHLEFSDHHNYTTHDIETIEKAFNKLSGDNKCIFTTEKDIMRLKEMNLPENIKENIYYLPIKPKFFNKENEFINEILTYCKG